MNGEQKICNVIQQHKSSYEQKKKKKFFFIPTRKYICEKGGFSCVLKIRFGFNRKLCVYMCTFIYKLILINSHSKTNFHKGITILPRFLKKYLYFFLNVWIFLPLKYVQNRSVDYTRKNIKGLSKKVISLERTIVVLWDISFWWYFKALKHKLRFQPTRNRITNMIERLEGSFS